MDVFVYGTLTDPERADSVLDDWRFRGAARLDGLRRVDGEYPTLAPGGSVEGRLLRTPEVDALDRYEGVDRGLYVRISVPRADGNGNVETYVGDADALGVAGSWPGEGTLGERARRHVREAGVVVVDTNPD
jgi:gamma-glutamylcyclotransferase (GGCT)/AIG2-like uncharacterized protein YtfP